MWNTKENAGVCLIPSFKQQERYLSGWFSTMPLAAGKSFQNPNFVNNLDNNYFKSSNNLSRNYRSSQYPNIIGSIKEYCPKVIPQSESKMGNKDITENPPGTNMEGNTLTELTPIREEKMVVNTKGCQEETSCTPETPSRSRIYDTPENQPIQNKQVTDTVTTNKIPSSQVIKEFNNMINTDTEENFTNIKRNHSAEKLICLRQRQPSICESEDSFIVFEDSDNDDSVDGDYDYDSVDGSYDDDGEEAEEGNGTCSESENESDDCEDDSLHSQKNKTVSFAPDSELCKVHPMVQWSFAYQAARKGPWEVYARDRSRFKDRICRTEKQLKHIFTPKHRNVIFEQRFENDA